MDAANEILTMILVMIMGTAIIAAILAGFIVYGFEIIDAVKKHRTRRKFTPKERAELKYKCVSMKEANEYYKALSSAVEVATLPDNKTS